MTHNTATGLPVYEHDDEDGEPLFYCDKHAPEHASELSEHNLQEFYAHSQANAYCEVCGDLLMDADEHPRFHATGHD